MLLLSRVRMESGVESGALRVLGKRLGLVRLRVNPSGLKGFEEDLNLF